MSTQQERQALDIAVMGIEAALDRLPENSAWTPSLQEARAVLTNAVRPRTFRDDIRDVMRDLLNDDDEGGADD